MVANDLVNDLNLADQWHKAPWEISDKNPKVWRDVYRLLQGIYAEVQDELRPST